MKPITLFTRPARIVYKHSVCSQAALLVLVLTIVTVLVPFYTTFGLNGVIWETENQHRTELLQPEVRFSFRYILVGEFHGSGDDASVQMVPDEEEIAASDDLSENDRIDFHTRVFTSYSFLNDLMTNQQHSISIKHWTVDLNYNQRADQIHLQFAFELPKTAASMSHLSLFLDLDARLTSAQSCSLRIPAALLVDRLPLPAHEIRPGTELHLAGRLRFQQHSSFHCPGFLRKRQTFFQHLELIQPNSTELQDYAIGSISEALRNNVGYLELEALTTNWQANPGLDQRIRLNVVIHIDEIAVRFWTSVGQQLFRMWMEYLAVLVVLWVVVERFKGLMFSKMWLRTWEVKPWKQKMQ